MKITKWFNRCPECGKIFELSEEPASSDAVLGESFDITVAIEDQGNCKRQNVNCEECKMGKFIFENGMKTRIDDLCDYKIVFLLARVVRSFQLEGRDEM